MAWLGVPIIGLVGAGIILWMTNAIRSARRRRRVAREEQTARIASLEAAVAHLQTGRVSLEVYVEELHGKLALLVSQHTADLAAMERLSRFFAERLRRTEGEEAPASSASDLLSDWIEGQDEIDHL